MPILFGIHIVQTPATVAQSLSTEIPTLGSETFAQFPIDTATITVEVCLPRTDTMKLLELREKRFFLDNVMV